LYPAAALAAAAAALARSPAVAAGVVLDGARGDGESLALVDGARARSVVGGVEDRRFRFELVPGDGLVGVVTPVARRRRCRSAHSVGERRSSLWFGWPGRCRSRRCGSVGCRGVRGSPHEGGPCGVDWRWRRRSRQCCIGCRDGGSAGSVGSKNALVVDKTVSPLDRPSSEPLNILSVAQGLVCLRDIPPLLDLAGDHHDTGSDLPAR